MFKDAATLDRQRTADSFDTALKRYAAQAEKWFDGSAGSVDRRLTACDGLRHRVRATVARLSSITDSRRYLAAAERLDADRRALLALRDDLLTGASSRADVVGPPGWRTAITHYPDDDEDDDSPTVPPQGDFSTTVNDKQKKRIRDGGDYGSDDEVDTNTGDGSDSEGKDPGRRAATTPPQGAVAGSNEFEHPAPRTNHPRYLEPSPVTAALHREAHWFRDDGSYAVPNDGGPHPRDYASPHEYLQARNMHHWIGQSQAANPGAGDYPVSDLGHAQTGGQGYRPPARLRGADKRWVQLESARFVAANTDTLDDNHELATRAHAYAALKTSTFTPSRSAAICEQFVARVASLGRQSYRPPITRVAQYQDFDPALLFLT